MSYNDDYSDRGEGYGEGRREHHRKEGGGFRRSNEFDRGSQGGLGGYGEGRSEEYGQVRREHYGHRREEGGYGGEGRSQEYGERRGEQYGHRREERGYGGSDEYVAGVQGGPGGYREGRFEEYGEGRGEHHGYRREEGGYGRHETEPEYDQRRHELREHGATGYGASRPGDVGGYGGDRPGSDNYYGQRSRMEYDGRAGGYAVAGERHALGGYGGRPHDTYGGGGGEGYGSDPPGGYGHSTGTPYGGGGYGGSDDYSNAEYEAQQHGGSSGDSALFANALSMLSGNRQRLQNEDVDEQDAVRSHQAMYGGGAHSGGASSSMMGNAAAMQAVKMFTGGQGGSQAGAGSQNQIIGMAMAQASKLFDQQSAQGNTVSSTCYTSALLSTP